MNVFQTPDRDLFMANRPHGAPVRVVRMPSAQVVQRNGRVETVPAVELTYSFMRGDQQWVFQEMRIGSAPQTMIDLSDTLWAELERSGDYQLLQRSGSF
jgi:hypothetical protein